MSFLIITAAVALITLLEAVDPGIASSFFPVPLLWIGLVVLLLRERHTMLSLRTRHGLTIAVTFFTIALVAPFMARSGSIGFVVLILAGATSTLLAWCATDPSYAHHPLPQDRPR